MRALAATLLLLAASAPVPGAPGAGRSCSIANGDVVKIASWDLDQAYARADAKDDALADIAAVIGKVDADVVALQGVSADHGEVNGALRRLRGSGRCYSAVESGGGLAVLFDPQALELLYAEGSARDCEGRSVAMPAPHAPARNQPGQLAYFRVTGPTPPRGDAFDFLLLNADATPDPEDLARLSARYASLEKDYPWLAQEQDRIVLGDLAVDGARLSRVYFPETKALINLLLKINLGLSDKTFDQAVAAARSPNAEGDKYNDNILVHRWDQPGACTDGPGYCGGLEEFINARVYDVREARIGSAVHPPVSARFCSFADSDPAAVSAR